MTSHHSPLRRTDPLTGREVIIAAARAERPIQVTRPVAPDTAVYDPFLEGNEQDTPSERLALRHRSSPKDAADWLLRVVPNRYPALTERTDSRLRLETQVLRHEQRESAAVGFHEVVIECPDPRSRLADLTVIEVARVLLAWQHRLRQLSASPDIRSISVFRNEGSAAGASLPHCHSQILAAGFLSQQLSQRVSVVEAFDQLRGQNHTCPYQQWLQAELDAESRIVAADGELAVICPFASRVTRHVRLCPIRECCHTATPFYDLDEPMIRLLAAQLSSVIRGMHRTGDVENFNLMLVLPPADQPQLFPWMLELLPRTSQFAGFELLTDVDILSVAPETTAAELIQHTEWLSSPDNAEMLWPVDYEWVST